MNLKKINLKNLVRIMLLMLGIFLFISIINLNKTYSKAEIKYKEEIVITGDTLWEIAKQESEYNEYYKGKDVRSIIYDLKSINNLTNSYLNEGQKISIPFI